MRRPTLHLPAILIAISSVVALPAFADFKQAFREGVRAYEKGQWQTVIANMHSAIEQQARSNEKVNISGGWNEPYMPHYYLAAAQANAGHCEDAAQAFRDGAGVAGGDKFKKIVEAKCGKLQLGPSPAELAEAARKAEEAKKEEARKAEAARIAEANKKAEDQKAEDARKAEAARIAEANKKAEDQKAEDARQAEAARIAEANKKADDQRAEAARKAAEATRIADEAKAATARLDEAKKSLTSRLKDANTFLATASNGNPATRATLTSAISTASGAVSRNALPEMQSASTALERAIRGVITTTARGDESLRTAVQAYLKGNYADTIDILATAKFSNAVLKGQAALFRAAANFALSTIKGQKTDEIALKIATDLGEFRSNHPGATLDQRVFSPAFRKLAAAR